MRSSSTGECDGAATGPEDESRETGPRDSAAVAGGGSSGPSRKTKVTQIIDRVASEAISREAKMHDKDETVRDMRSALFGAYPR